MGACWKEQKMTATGHQPETVIRISGFAQDLLPVRSYSAAQTEVKNYFTHSLFFFNWNFHHILMCPYHLAAQFFCSRSAPSLWPDQKPTGICLMVTEDFAPTLHVIRSGEETVCANVIHGHTFLNCPSVCPQNTEPKNLAACFIYITLQLHQTNDFQFVLFSIS